MLKQKTYSCGICKSKADQISHHKSHLETEKHKDKTELFQLRLSKLSENELLSKYNSSDIEIIIDALVNTVYEYKDNKTENKKLNSETTENEDTINTSDNTTSLNITTEEMEAQNTTDTITNKEALKDKIHELHNYLRNNGAGYGMNALKVFNILYGLKKIEEKNLFEKANLKVPDAKFSVLLNLANTANNTLTYENLSKYIDEDVLESINNSKIKDLLMYEIPKNIKGNVFAHIIKEIDNITKIEKECNVLLSGKIYEYFIGRDETAISELGAYFTDRHIVDYIYNKLQPTINEDGTIGTMIDMFGGSGGFTTGYINYLNSTYNNSSIPIEKHINWETELKKIFHFDMNEDVIKSAGLEFFCLTGTLPDMKNNLCYSNSFVNEFSNKKFKYPITNPPYGGDKNKETDAQIKRNKIKDYIKKLLVSVTDEDKKAKLSIQLKELEKTEKAEKKETEKTKVSVDMSSQRISKFAKKYALKGNDKESVSLMLIMDIVDLGGTAIGVLKEGVFFNRSYKDLRKCLVENFNVREIISIPQDQFENTSTKTSIVIFDNLETIKTTEVNFYDLVVERYTEDKFIEGTNGFIYLLENKDDIKGISDTLISSATRDEILNNPIVSLNGKDYNKKEIICGEGYELVKLGDICEFLPKSKRKASFGKTEGKYNFYTSSDKVQKCNIADYESESILIGTGGNSSIHYTKQFSCSADNLLITSQKLNNKYIYYIIKSMWVLLISNMRGSTIKHITKDMLKSFQIPIPKTPAKIAEWVEKISKPYDEKNTKQEKIQELEKLIQSTIKNITENEECDEVELGSICEKIKPKFNINTNELDNNGLYPFYNKIGINIGYHSKYNYDILQGILLTKDGGSGPKIYGENIALGGVMLIKGMFAATYANFVLQITQNRNINYIYYLLKNIKNDIMDLANYSVKIGHIKYEKLLKIKIKIPKNKKIIEDMEPLFKEIETLQNDVKKAEELYKQLINELSKEAIPNQPIINEVKTIENTEIEIQEEIVEIPITTKKKISIKSAKSKKISTTLNDILSNESNSE